MQIDIIETTGLGDRSYLISDGGIGVVTDPQRDADGPLLGQGSTRSMSRWGSITTPIPPSLIR